MELAGIRQAASPELPETQFLRDLVTLIEGIHSARDAAAREERLANAAASISDADLPEAIRFLWHKKHLSSAGEELRNRLLQRWTALNPKMAADWVLQQPPGGPQAGALEQLATSWARLNSKDAVAWAKQLPEGDLRNRMLAQIAYETAATSPLEAMTLAVDLPAESDRDDLIAHTAGTWAAKDPEGALNWSQQIQDVELRERILVSIINAIASDDPERGAQLAVDLLQPGRNQDDAVMSLLQHWAQQDPEKVGAWVASFPEGDLRQTAIQNLVSIWADADLNKVGNWLSGLAPGPFRDAGIAALISKLSPRAPDEAATWIPKISDPKRRQQEAESLGESAKTQTQVK